MTNFKSLGLDASLLKAVERLGFETPTEVQSDLKSNHDRHISRGLIQEISENVSEIAKLKEDVWEYSLPEKKKETPCISLGMDSAMMLMRNDGYRETMVGTIALHDSE